MTMNTPVDLYDSAYANYELEAYRQIRIETYGEDLGQTSWVTSQESGAIANHLDLTTESSVLEVGCGSGKYALHLAQQAGCRMIGIDLNPHGIATANLLAKNQGLNSRVRFEVCDAAKKLPFEASAFDAVFSNDALCHIPGRASVLAEIHRVLRPGGRLLFSDALVIGGLISHHEIATRSSIGYYLFSPPGENEKLISTAGFRLLNVADTTDAAAGIARRWRQARVKREQELLAIEGEKPFQGLQAFLDCVETLTKEKRLLRLVYLARKEA